MSLKQAVEQLENDLAASEAARKEAERQVELLHIRRANEGGDHIELRKERDRLSAKVERVIALAPTYFDGSISATQLRAALDGSGAAAIQHEFAEARADKWDGVERRKFTWEARMNLGPPGQPVYVYMRGPQRALHANTRKP